MILYNITQSNTLPINAQDFMSLISSSTRSFGILEIDGEGAGTASAYTEMAIYRVTSIGSSGGSSITPVPLNPASPTSGITVYTAWSAQPTIGAKIHSIPINSNGQRYFWRCMQNLSNAIWSPGGGAPGGSLSIRPVTISGAITLRVQVAEI